MSLVERLESVIEPVLSREGYELVDLDYSREGGRRFLRLFVDKEGGITLGDCEHISDTVGAYLEHSDIIDEAYHLEVSSPGLDRVIKKEKDYRRFSGRKVVITTFAPLDGRRKFSGTLKGLEDGEVLVEVEERVFRIPLQDISKTRLAIEL